MIRLSKLGFLKVVVPLLMLFLVSSCKEKIKDAIKKGLESGDETISEANFKHVEVDSLYAVSIPKYMKEMPNLNDQATLQYGNVYKNLYTVVIHEDKEDFIDYYTEIGAYNDSISILDNYTTGQVQYFKKSLIECMVIPYQLKNIKGHDARQCGFNGVVGGVKVAYLVAYIEAKDDLFMIMSWTDVDRFNRFENTFEAINDSFEYLLNTEKIDEIQ